MVAASILAIVALGTVAYVTQARCRTGHEALRYAALLKATERLEQVRRTAFAAIAPSAHSYSISYLDNITGTWRVGAADQGETVMLGNQPYHMATTVQYLDADGGFSSYDCLRVTVTVQYGTTAANCVMLQTIQSP